MAVVSLELFKKHVNADDFADDDQYLQHLIVAAESHVIRMTNRSESELSAMNGGLFPDELKQAILVLGAHWYNQRESDAQAQFHSVPNTLQALVKPFRKLG